MIELLNSELFQLAVTGLISGLFGAIGYKIRSKALVDLVAFFMSEVSEEILARASDEQKKTLKKINKRTSVQGTSFEIQKIDLKKK